MFEWLKHTGRSNRPSTSSSSPSTSTADELAQEFATQVQASAQDDIRRLHMVFSGEVQGVGFRWNARTCATELGLTGWVRNEWDGSVTMELQGSSERIARFFTAFNNQYRHYHISYTIEEKRDIRVLEDESEFRVLFT